MNLESFRDMCLSHAGVTEGFPFDDRTLVFKVKGKMFALADINLFEVITLKNTLERVAELQEKYGAVRPGYHMNKKHWITVTIDHSVSDAELRLWIIESYSLVASGLGKKKGVN